MKNVTTWLAVLACTGVIAISSVASAAWGTSTTILQVDQNRSGYLNGVTRVYLEGQPCTAETGIDYFYIAAGDEALRSLALAAYLSGRQVRVETSGSCSIRTLRLQ